MNDEAPILNEEQIIELYRAGRLAEHVFSDASLLDELDTLCSLYVDLHNRDQIDFLSLTKTPTFDALTPHQFFNGQHVFCQVIPALKASTVDMMDAVDRLVKKGGNDLASNEPNAAFRQWCAIDSTRAKEVIDAARLGNELALRMLTFALETGSLFDEAIDFIKNYTGQARLSAITAVSRMDLTETHLKEALSVFLETICNNYDDALYANVLHASFQIASTNSDIAEFPTFQSIAAHVCNSPGPQVHYSCARILWSYTECISPDIFSLLGNALKSLDPAHKATIAELDNGLRKLLETPLALEGARLLRDLLVEKQPNLALSEFPDFGHRLLEKFEGAFQEILVEWLLSGEAILCHGLSRLLGESAKDEQPIALSAHNLELRAVEQIYLCRKAIGYFFLQPVFSASIIVSVLRVCPDDARDLIRNLLFDPLLRNYGGKLRDYLSSIEESDGAFAAVRAALDDAERYLDDVKGAGEAKELSPSESQRQAAHRRDADEIRATQKQAMKQSVFASLVHRSAILYGKRTLTVIGDLGGESRLMEMNMEAHSFGWEVPRMMVIDPVGLDFLLRVFRVERLRNETDSA